MRLAVILVSYTVTVDNSFVLRFSMISSVNYEHVTDAVRYLNALQFTTLALVPSSRPPWSLCKDSVRSSDHSDADFFCRRKKLMADSLNEGHFIPVKKNVLINKEVDSPSASVIVSSTGSICPPR